MPGAGAIRAGEAFVEITASDAKLKKGLSEAQSSLTKFSQSIKASFTEIGASLAGLGATISAPFALGINAFKGVDEQLANLRAAANPSAEDLQKISSAVNSISIQTGTGPAEVAAVFTELQKAGIDIQTALGGAAKSALQFSKVAGIDTAGAAKLLGSALNVFASEEIEVTDITNALSAAASASGSSIQELADAFTGSSQIFAENGGMMKDLVAALGMLSESGIKGGEAGAGINKFLISLAAPSAKGAEAISNLGIATRDSNKHLLPMADLIQNVSDSINKLPDDEKAHALKDIFGAKSMRTALVLLSHAADGFSDFSEKMSTSLTVAQKYEILTNTLSGRLNSLYAALQRVGVAIGAAVSEPLKNLINTSLEYLNGIALIINRHQEMVITIAKIGVGLTIAGGAFLGAAFAAKAFHAAFAGLSIAFSVGTAVVGVLSSAIAGIPTIIGGIVSAVGFVGGALVAAFAAPGATILGLVASLGSIATAAVSPVIAIGAIGAAFVAAGAYIFATTGGIQQSLQYLDVSFGDLKETTVSTFEGITDAIKAGNIELAMQILWEGVNVAWKQGTLALQEVWLGFKNWFLEIVRGTFYGAVIVVADALYGIKKTWVTVVNGWGDILNRFFNKFRRGWNDTVGWFAKVWTKILNPGADEATITAINKRIDAETTRQDNAINGRSVDSRIAGEKEILDIEEERKNVVIALANEAGDGTNAQKELDLSAIKSSKSGLESSKNRLAELLSQASKEDEESTLRNSGEIIKPEIKNKIDNIGVAASQVSKKYDVTGTFNVAALSGLSIGGSAMERMEKHAAKTAKNTGRIAQGIDELEAE